jgi:hypothetical protein
MGSKKHEGTGGWKASHNSQLRNLHVVNEHTNVIRSCRTRWEARAPRMGEVRNTYRILGICEGKKSLGKLWQPTEG